MNTILTQAVLAYQRTGDGWPDLLDRIRLYVYEFPDRWSDWDEDRRSEFFLAFQGRIPAWCNAIVRTSASKPTWRVPCDGS